MSWNLYTAAAKNVVFLAQQEAQNLGEGFVNTEHLLLGILRHPPCAATRALEYMGFSCKELEARVKTLLNSNPNPIKQEMQLTVRGKNVITHALLESKRMSDNFIGTEHLLLGLILEGIDTRTYFTRLLNSSKWEAGAAALFLQERGVELEKTRQSILSVRGAHLLRASDAPVNADELLRTVQENPNEPSEELLRASEPDTPTQT